MSTDLRSQLVEYGVHHRDQQIPVDLDEIMALGEKVRPMPVEHPSPRRWRRGLATAVATGVLVLLAFGLVSFLLLDGESETQPAGTVSTTPAPTTDPNIQAEPDVDETMPTGSTVPSVVTMIPPQPLPPQTTTALDAGQLNWKSPNFGDVSELNDVVDTVILGPVEGQHLVVVEEAPGAIEDELLVSEDGVEFSRREEASFLVGDGDATDVIVGADLIWLTPLSGGSVYRSADGVTWTRVEFTGVEPILHWKAEFDQPIVRRGTTIVTAYGSSIFASTDDGHSFVELAPFGEVPGHEFLTAGATADEFFAVAAQGNNRVLVAHSDDGLDWTVHPEPVDLGVVLDENAYFGNVSGDDPSLFLITDVRGPHVFKYSRNGAEIRIDEVAALEGNLIAELGVHSPDSSVLYGISAHHWEGRFVLRREGPRWALFVSDDGVDWGSITLGGVFDGGKPFFSSGLVFVRGGDVLAINEVALD